MILPFLNYTNQLCTVIIPKYACYFLYMILKNPVEIE